MTEKEIRKLNRQDLLVLLEEQTARANKLEEQLHATETRLQERNILFENCGTLAEASLKLNGVFEAADEAAKQYLENIKKMHDDQTILCSSMEQESKKKAEEIMQEADKYVEEKRKEGEEIIRQAQEKASQEIAKIDKRWEEIYNRICGMEKEYAWMKGLIKDLSGDK